MHHSAVIATRTTAGNDFTVCMEYFLHMRAGTFSPFASHTKGQTPLSDGRECPKEKVTHRQSRWFFICACKALLPAAP